MGITRSGEVGCKPHNRVLKPFTSRAGDKYRACSKRPAMGSKAPKDGCMILVTEKACIKMEELIKTNDLIKKPKTEKPSSD